MDIICDQCQSKFRIPDEKVPAGMKASFPCPKCKNKISVGPRPTPAPVEKPTAGGAPQFDEMDTDAYDASDKPFDFVEEEGKTALICEVDPGVRKIIAEALHLMEYHITEAKDARDALKRMRYHVYDLVLVNERFDTANPDTNGILIYLERLNMSTRRSIFVAMFSDRFRTMDNMMAFQKSVNLIVNMQNMADIAKILRRGITDSEYFYRVYKESLKKIMGV